MGGVIVDKQVIPVTKNDKGELNIIYCHISGWKGGVLINSFVKSL